MGKLKTPDFTPEAITTLISTLLGNVYILFGTAISPEWKGAISGISTTAVLVAFLIHSAIIRGNRAKAEAIKAAAGDTPDGEPFAVDS